MWNLMEFLSPCCKFYLFIYGLFNDDVSSSDCIAFNDRMISELWNGKDVEGSGCGLI
jgi:hypothetical protein